MAPLMASMKGFFKGKGKGKGKCPSAAGDDTIAGSEAFHPGVSCDKSGMCPIVGPRYNLKGHDYDLCEAEFNKLDPSEQANYQKIDPPFRPHQAKGKGKCPWATAGNSVAGSEGFHPGVSC